MIKRIISIILTIALYELIKYITTQYLTRKTNTNIPMNFNMADHAHLGGV
ncbi:transcriptional activator RinB [Staphylococcus capitis]